MNIDQTSPPQVVSKLFLLLMSDQHLNCFSPLVAQDLVIISESENEQDKRKLCFQLRRWFTFSVHGHLPLKRCVVLIKVQFYASLYSVMNINSSFKLGRVFFTSSSKPCTFSHVEHMHKLNVACFTDIIHIHFHCQLPFRTVLRVCLCLYRTCININLHKMYGIVYAGLQDSYFCL